MPLLIVSVGAFLAGLLAAWIVKTSLVAPVHLIGSWLVLRHAENPGIAFGVRLPSPWQEILILCALVVVGFVAVRAKTLLAAVAYGLILGGALANVADRLVDGVVTDYVAAGSFPVFNLPDSCISVGVALLLVESVVMMRSNRKKT